MHSAPNARNLQAMLEMTLANSVWIIELAGQSRILVSCPFGSYTGAPAFSTRDAVRPPYPPQSYPQGARAARYGGSLPIGIPIPLGVHGVRVGGPR